MKKVKLIGGDVVVVSDGVVSSSDKSIETLATALLEETLGRFNNNEAYPDRDSSIASFLAMELNGKRVD